MILTQRLGSKFIQKASKLPPETLTIPVVSGYSISERYKQSEKSDKRNVLIRDLFVLGASGAGIIAGSKVAGRLIKTPRLKNVRNDILNGICTPVSGIVAGVSAGELSEHLFPAKHPPLQQDIKQVILKKLESLEHSPTSQGKKENEQNNNKNRFKAFAKSTGVAAFTFIGVLSGASLPKYFLKQKQNLSSTIQDGVRLSSILLGGVIGNVASRGVLNSLLPGENTRRFNLSDASIRHFNIINYEVNSFMNRNLPSVSGFDTGREVGFENKVRRGFNDIISGIIVPSAIILPTVGFVRAAIAAKKIPAGFVDRFVDNIPVAKIREKYKSSQEMKNQLLEKAVLFPVTIAGLYAGETTSEWFKKKVAEKITKETLLRHLPDLKKDLLITYLQNMGSKNEKIKSQIVEDLSKVNQLEKEIIKTK